MQRQHSHLFRYQKLCECRNPNLKVAPEVENESWTQKWQVLREGGAEELQDGKWRTYLMAPKR